MGSKNRGRLKGSRLSFAEQQRILKEYDYCITEACREAFGDPVNAPSHYRQHPSGVECITITRHMNFNLGNAIKYLWRSDYKGAKVEDLKKAVFYIQDEIKRLEKSERTK